MSGDVSEATEGLANEALLILQPFRRRFTYVKGTSPTSPGEPPMKPVRKTGDLSFKFQLRHNFFYK